MAPSAWEWQSESSRYGTLSSATAGTSTSNFKIIAAAVGTSLRDPAVGHSFHASWTRRITVTGANKQTIMGMDTV
eukprot:scaffold169814_cov22-Prasinocladus_malaysianus.AAC.1